MIRTFNRLHVLLGLGLACIALALASPSAHAEPTKERILREGKIVIGVHNRAPWGYRDEATGQATGWHPDLLKAAFSELGVEEIDIRVTEFGALIPGLLAGRFDAVGSGLSITPERCQQVAFGAPDLKERDAALVLPGNPKNIHGYKDILENNDVIMGAGRGSVVVRKALAEGIPSERMLLFPDIQSNVAALRTGRVDAVLLSLPTVLGLMRDGAVPDVEPADPFVTTDEQATFTSVAFRQDDEDLKALYNERFMALKEDGTVARIMAKYGFGEEEMVSEGITTERLCSATKDEAAQ
ncbi:ectoine/hydroxyectoine ABC transporter substrate-binding protein EhuB [Mesorhizobium microcysteis]|uniref:Ectoine/hydroxyectoine ABC transporter substrate-binding protein EhuB n=1 Tax=Neoaquamicrobium microcysteis TaxID=2682781 RepID=A0A5D4H874_9HYPH|nr:ectoine/hydroxyectoine ABC transporter substrate-binding protein EhuB [Mesorhizobium microcysteis]TYR36744.1 ectoine/hydroxyectoine ABC transporter substrate-binding protein EhuB [Mesorhizobium microcysteis]